MPAPRAHKHHTATTHSHTAHTALASSDTEACAPHGALSTRCLSRHTQPTALVDVHIAVLAMPCPRSPPEDAYVWALWLEQERCSGLWLRTRAAQRPLAETRAARKQHRARRPTSTHAQERCAAAVSDGMLHTPPPRPGQCALRAPRRHCSLEASLLYVARRRRRGRDVKPHVMFVGPEDPPSEDP